jgi:hypothetical protein
MKSTICTTETGLVLGVMSLEGEEDAAFTRGEASPDAGKDGRHHHARKP